MDHAYTKLETGIELIRHPLWLGEKVLSWAPPSNFTLHRVAAANEIVMGDMDQVGDAANQMFFISVFIVVGECDTP